MPADDIAVIVSARDEAERLGATLAALADAFPGARVVVADDGSADATAAVARAGGAEVVSVPRPLGKGGAATLGARHLLGGPGGAPALVVLCDGDLGASAARLAALAPPVRAGECDVAVAVFARRVGGGVGAAVGFARWMLRRRTGLELRAPISGQRVLTADALRAVVPFAPRFGMEVAMTIDATRAGLRVCEVELDLEHRATGRTVRGFAHRARQLSDFVWVAVTR